MSLYNIQVRDAQNNVTTLEPYKGKVLLFVNTATKCGYTKQYEGLQKIYDKYKDKGFEILDFPCNQFLGQAPGSMEHIKEFCELNFGTKFPLFKKLRVNGFGTHPLYRYLKKNAPLEMTPDDLNLNVTLKSPKPQRIKWNFTKFLVNKDGEIMYRFSPRVTPEELDPFIASLFG